MPLSLLEPDEDSDSDDTGVPITRIGKRQQNIISALAGDMCLYPGCNEFLFDATLVVADPPYIRPYDWKTIGQFAHVRSPKPGGPRYDPDYPKELLNTWQNAFLACGRHHYVVDHFPETYPVKLLDAWIDESSEGTLLKRVTSSDIKKTLLTRRFIWANRQLRQQLKPAV